MLLSSSPHASVLPTASPGPAALYAAGSVLSKLLSPSPSASLSAPAVQHGITTTPHLVVSLCGLCLWDVWVRLWWPCKHVVLLEEM